MINSKIASSHFASQAVTSLILAIVVVTMTGCGASIDSFTYVRNKLPKSSRTMVADADTQGTSVAPSTSSKHTLDQQMLNNSTVRTQSSSPSFKMVSGVGVQ